MTPTIPTVPTLPLPPDPVRQRLISYFEGLIAEGHEGALAARGVDNAMSAAHLVTMAALRAGEYFVFLKALQPGPTVLPASPDGVSKAVLLVAAEVEELAEHHETVAAAYERQGDHNAAGRRRDRACQLRGLLRGGDR